MLACQDISCGEGEEWSRAIWCFRKLLKDKYGVEYRIISPSPVPDARGRSQGYNSIAEPVIQARLGKDWYNRVFSEAQALYRHHWRELAPLYKDDHFPG